MLVLVSDKSLISSEGKEILLNPLLSINHLLKRIVELEKNIQLLRKE
jgi:hypothetical protein